MTKSYPEESKRETNFQNFVKSLVPDFFQFELEQKKDDTKRHVGEWKHWTEEQQIQMFCKVKELGVAIDGLDTLQQKRVQYNSWMKYQNFKIGILIKILEAMI